MGKKKAEKKKPGFGELCVVLTDARDQLIKLSDTCRSSRTLDTMREKLDTACDTLENALDITGFIGSTAREVLTAVDELQGQLR